MFAPAAEERNENGYFVRYSGGKDSDVLVDLFIRAGVKFMINHSLTTIDAPETVRHVREQFARWKDMGILCIITRPENNMNFYSLCEKYQMLPSRWYRFCCLELKERTSKEYRHALRAFGVRKTESHKRANRDVIETGNNRKKWKEWEHFKFDDSEDVLQTGTCYTNNYFYINPIAEYTTEDVWNYIRERGLSVNPLYSKGFERVGCIGCPLASGRRMLWEYEMWPQYFYRLMKTIETIQPQLHEKFPDTETFANVKNYVFVHFQTNRM